MKLLYRGGLNKYDPDGFKKSYFYEYSDTIISMIKSGKRVCFVTFAKPDRYYDQYIKPQFDVSVDIIDNSSLMVNWNQYDLIFLCGGNTLELKQGLRKYEFDLGTLKKDSVVLGDSAGAMILAPFFYDTEDRVQVEFIEGIYKKPKYLIAVHTNNTRYFNEVLEDKISNFAYRKGLSILKLSENETKLYNPDKDKFEDFEFEELFV